MEDNKIKIQKQFREKLIDFLDEIVEMHPRESEFILMRMVIKQIPLEDLIGKFIRDILPLEEYVKKRDESFFLNNTILYIDGKLGEDQINHFKNLWLSNSLDDEERDTIWLWMDMFINISNEYKNRYGYVSGWECT